MAKENTAPLKGTRDFLPQDVRRREHVLSVVRDVYGRYGFEPLETPAMERLETLLGKYGEEGDQLIFRILHRGAELGRALDRLRAQPGAAASSREEARAAFKRDELALADSALRYDLTVPLARVVAEYQAQLPRFFKRYQIQPVWRADRPAAGRFREFYQCDVDIVGSRELVCEVEVASAVCEVLDRLGFDDYRVRLNHRGLLRGMIEAAGIPLEHEVTAITELDKLGKVSADEVKAALVERGVPAGSAARLLEVALAATGGASGAEVLDGLEGALRASERGAAGVSELRRLLALASDAPCGRRLALDPSLARGLSYYTGPIFEIQVSDLAGSLGGGGRYDELIGMFLRQPVPAVGFSLGLERILVVMAERGMFPDLTAAAHVMVLRLDEATTPDALRAASALRGAGIRTELYPNVDKLGKQLQYASGRAVKLAVFVGEREQAAGEVAIKVMETQEQHVVPAGALVETVRRLLGP
ncbi:MAG TPA: histidine--tRNA ligase [Anaeromyxobacteraceae bacterium]|nr:histidine--tRNA ligase [Anaeromyxobacteraceae bacterium]